MKFLSSRPATAALGLLLIAALPAAARSYRAGVLEITDPWTRPAPAGAMGVGYMAISNSSNAAVALVSAKTPAAKTVSLHQTTVTGGVARMAAVPDGIVIPARGKTAFAPGGYHLMLEGLVRPLAMGARTPLTLTYSNGRTVQVELTVQTQPAAPAMGAMPGMDRSGH